MTQVTMKIAKNLTPMMKLNDTCESVTGSYVALYLSPDSFEFFSCYVTDVGVAPEMMVDDCNHIIEKGSMNLQCSSVGKNLKKEVFYKILKKIAYVLPAQVVTLLHLLMMIILCQLLIISGWLIVFKYIFETYFENLSKYNLLCKI